LTINTPTRQMSISQKPPPTAVDEGFRLGCFFGDDLDLRLSNGVARVLEAEIAAGNGLGGAGANMAAGALECAEHVRDITRH
jgi:hypothetical protein